MIRTEIIAMEITSELLDHILDQMISENLVYDDYWAEFYEGTNTTYQYDKEKQGFTRTQADVIAASFIEIDELSRVEMKEALKECVKYEDLLEQGFKI